MATDPSLTTIEGKLTIRFPLNGPNYGLDQQSAETLIQDCCRPSSRSSLAYKTDGTDGILGTPTVGIAVRAGCGIVASLR